MQKISEAIGELAIPFIKKYTNFSDIDAIIAKMALKLWN
jgi:hypothetical protein